jgi:hypothetical protein
VAGAACEVANATLADPNSFAVASNCCPIAYRSWGYGYGGPYY